jgi:predicted lipoprotein with Yx(FWY)xxD motif
MHATTRPVSARALAGLAGMAAALLVASACSSKTNTASGGTATSGASTATTASAQAGSRAATGGAMISTTKGSLGTFLVDAQGRTLYLFAADTSTTSTCYDACATYWPPALTSGKPTAGSGVDSSKLGTTTRKDGSLQVTYGGHPLYTFLKDKKSGDTTGQGSNNFNAKWWVVGTDGNAITAASGGGSSSGGYTY